MGQDPATIMDQLRGDGQLSVNAHIYAPVVANDQQYRPKGSRTDRVHRGFTHPLTTQLRNKERSAPLTPNPRCRESTICSASAQPPRKKGMKRQNLTVFVTSSRDV